MDPIAAFVVALVVGAAGYLAGKRSSRNDSGATWAEQKRLEEYSFYPFSINPNGHVEFDPAAFNHAVDHFLAERNQRAAGELVVIGEQNLVRDTFTAFDLARYKRLYEEYDGDGIVSDNDRYLENYRRLVNQLGRSVKGTGIEILLHNLVNPSRSLVAIENGEVTGRSVGSGATNLVLDLKTRRQRGEDKVNYELNIGSRQFKCTTVPIFRPDYGLVGAICVNVDANFLRDAVMGDEDRLLAFVDNLLRTDFQLDENILSPDEYQAALRGKRHFLDESIRAGGSRAAERRLAAIFFSDVVGYTSMMGEDESRALGIMTANEDIHRMALARHGGRILKMLGDGILASFDSASGAVAAARHIREDVASDGRFQIRIGIHLGEVVHEGADVHGDGVNIASRIQAEMEPGGVGLSQVVYDNIKNKDGFEVVSLGERRLKNVGAPIALYTLD